MKKLLLSLCITVLFVTTAGAAQSVPAAPISALFYPNEVQLTVEEHIAPVMVPGKGKVLRVTLPQGRVQDFFATVNGSPAGSLFRLENSAEEPAKFSSNENNPERKTLLLTIETLAADMDKIRADITAAETRIALWQQRQPRKDGLTPDEMLKLDAAYAEHLPQLHASISRNKREIVFLESEHGKAESALEEYDGRQQENTIAIPFDGPEHKTALVRYTYIMPGTCQTTYSLNAFPAKGVLRIDQEAALYQSSGQTWANVDVYISTTRRDTAIRPAAMTPWVMSLHDKNAPQPSGRHDKLEPRVQASQINAAEMQVKDMGKVQRQAPVQAEMGTFRLWSLGKRTISSNAVVTLPLASDEYKAHYFYTLQPAYNPKGFLTAELNLDKALELPPGRARIFVDNVSVGEQPLSINGNKALLYFGTDPQVVATMRDVKQSKGEQGFISKEQSRLWHWEIVVRNTRNRPVEVWVLDPIPNAQDTAIKLNVDSKPKPEETTTARQFGSMPVYRWKFSLQPGESKTIDHKVQLTAPADKNLFIGGRR